MLKIPLRFKHFLQGQPEYGMGYQKGRVKPSTGAYQAGFIFNGAIFINSEELNSMTPSQLWLAEWKLNQQTAILPIAEITLIPRSPETLRGVRRISTTNFSNAKRGFLFEANEIRASQAAKDAPIMATVVDEVFKRFSAYADDFKVTDKQGLIPGTFATTAEDAENVKTGRDAVARYALENKQSANKRFTIMPAEKTSLQRGIVQPAYGEPGGGVEVIFVNGTGDNTVSGPDTIPE